MRYISAMLGFIVTANVLGAEPPADPLAESERLNEEIARLTAETPVASEVESLRSRMRENSRELQDQINELSKTPEWKEYQRRRSELETARNRRLTEEREVLSEAGRRLYAERHAELRRAAVVELVEGARLGLDVLSYPQIDGSTSTHPLSIIIASRLLGVPYDWRYAPIAAGFRAYDPETAKLLLPFDPHARTTMSYRDTLELNIAACRVYAAPASGDDPRQQRIARMINSLLANHSNTHAAHVNLIEGRCDLILSARAPSESELTLAAEKNVKLLATPIAKDALVFLVNRGNPLQNLTQEQLREIYRGNIVRWNALGWRDPPDDGLILPLRRERDSGSRELFDELLMEGEQLPDPPDPYTVEMFETRDMSGPYNRITRSPRALGFSVYYYERYMAMSPQTRVIAIDGVEPTFDSIASGTYPLAAPVYAVHREDQPPDSAAMKLLAWLLSDEGQAVIRESGYVPIGAGR